MLELTSSGPIISGTMRGMVLKAGRGMNVETPSPNYT